MGELFRHIRTRKPEEVEEIVKRIRTDADVFDVLRFVQEGDILLQHQEQHQPLPDESGNAAFRPMDIDSWAMYHDHIKGGAQLPKGLSDHATSQAILNVATSRFAYEVMVSHPQMYPQARDEVDAVDLPSAHDIELACLGLIKPPSSGYGPYSHRMTGPSRPPEHIDSRLWRLDISRWTQVHTPHGWAAQAISLYLATDHAVATLIDANLFLKDMIDGRTDFCSPLLVSSLMFWASVSTL